MCAGVPRHNPWRGRTWRLDMTEEGRERRERKEIVCEGREWTEEERMGVSSSTNE